MADKLLTIEETAKYLDVHPMTLYKWARDDKVPATKIGKVWRFRKEKLDKWLDKHTEVK